MADEARQQMISGWVGISETSNKDMLIYLYDEKPALNFPIAYLYEEEFGRIPEHAQEELDAVVKDEGVNKYLVAGPLKSDALAEGWMHVIDPPFPVTIIKKRIDWSATNVDAARPQGNGNGSVGPSAGPYVWTPLTSEQLTKADELAGELAGLQWGLAVHVLEGFAEGAGIEPDNVEADKMAELIPDVYRGTSYEFAKVWPTVRGAVVMSLDEAASLEVLLDAIGDGEAEDFTKALAANHPLILDAAFAGVILKTLGETGVKSEPEDRVEQAKKAAMYIELTSRHGVSKANAKAVIGFLYDEIPF